MKNSTFARFALAFFIYWHFEDVLVLSTTWNDLFCSCVDDVSIWCQMFNFIVLCPKCWSQFNSRTVRTHFSSVMTLNNWKMIPETRSYIFRWRSCFRRRRVCLSSLLPASWKRWNFKLVSLRGHFSLDPTLWGDEQSVYARDKIAQGGRYWSFSYPELRSSWPAPLIESSGTHRSNACACLSHARAIWARVGTGHTISIETNERQNGGRFKFRGVCFHFPGIRRKQNS